MSQAAGVSGTGMRFRDKIGGAPLRQTRAVNGR